MTFLRCFLFTLTAAKLYTFMNRFNECQQIAFLSCLVFTLAARKLDFIIDVLHFGWIYLWNDYFLIMKFCKCKPSYVLLHCTQMKSPLCSVPCSLILMFYGLVMCQLWCWRQLRTIAGHKARALCSKGWPGRYCTSCACCLTGQLRSYSLLNWLHSVE